MTKWSRHQAAQEPMVPLVEILDVMPPVFAAHDAHPQPPLLSVRIDLGFFLFGSNWGFLPSTVAMDLWYFC